MYPFMLTNFAIRKKDLLDILYNSTYCRYIKNNMSQGAPFRPMKYPYTFTAKIAQFPYKYYIQHSWLYKYLLIGTLVAMPIFYKIQKLSFSPENVEKWDKVHREMFYGSPGGHH